MLSQSDSFVTSVVDAKGVSKNEVTPVAPVALVPVKIPFSLNSYKTDCASMGRVYIFSHRTYDKKIGLTDRKGNEFDEKALCTAMVQLGYDNPIILPDFKRTDIEKHIQIVADADHTNFNSIVLVFLTHGENGKLWAYDMNYSVESIWKPFLNENKTLFGKPKIFFIQACQGTAADGGFRKLSTVDAAGVQPEVDPETVDFKIPRFADILIAYSTPAGFVSFREETKGSWFIQSLCDCVNQVKPNLSEFDLETILVMVKHHIAYNLESHCTIAEYNEKKQIPYISSTLTKKLYLAPPRDGSEVRKSEIDSRLGLTSVLKQNGINVTSADGSDDDGDDRVSSSKQKSENNTVNNKKITIELDSGIKIHVYQP